MLQANRYGTQKFIAKVKTVRKCKRHAKQMHGTAHKYVTKGTN